MSTEVELVNRAMQLIGTRTTIASMDEASNEARQASIAFAPTRKEVLRTAPWNFAKRTIQAELFRFAPGTPEFSAYSEQVAQNQWSPEYPAPPWLYSYFYPFDALMIRFVQAQVTGSGTPVVPIFSSVTPYYWYSNTPAVKFEVGVDYTQQGSGAGTATRVILTDAQNAIVTYTLDTSDTEVWDHLFESMFVFALAAKLVNALTGDKALANQLIERANAVAMQARINDGNEALVVLDWIPEWIKARPACFEVAGVGDAPLPSGQAYSNPYSGQYMLLGLF